jgi:hypothetical protein
VRDLSFREKPGTRLLALGLLADLLSLVSATLA